MLIRDKKLVEFFGVLFLYIFSLARIITEFLDENYSIDVDAFIYVGQQVRLGNPVWISEWTGPPLLVEDFLFAIASPLGPAKTWMIVSVSAALLAVVCVRWLLPGLLQRMGYKNEEARRVSVLAGGIYLLVSGHMPSGFSHINVLPASMAIIALLLAFRLTQVSKSWLNAPTVTVLAGFAAAVSISVRPYFIFPLAIGFIYVCLMIFFWGVSSVGGRIYRVSMLLGAPTVIGFALNLGPYIYLGEGRAWFTHFGFFFQLPPTGGISLSETLGGVVDEISPLRLWLAGMLLFSLTEVIVGVWRRSNFLAVTLVPLSAIALAAGIESLHFWDHYLNFFSWYFSILLSARLVFLDRVFSPSVHDSSVRFTAPSLILPFALSAFAAALLFVEVGDPSQAPKVTKISSEHHDLAFAKTLESKLINESASRATFFAPTNDYVHWKLEESRYGFPNSFMVGQISTGKWANFPEASFTFRAPRNAHELCDGIWDSPIEVVVLPEDSELNSLCFSKGQNPWLYEPLEVSDAEVWTLWWRP